jgi:hypothetical protein
MTWSITFKRVFTVKCRQPVKLIAEARCITFLVTNNILRAKIFAKGGTTVAIK